MTTIIKSISFPNNVIDSEKSFYESPKHFFKVIQKNGEMATVNWIEVWEGEDKEGCYKHKIAEIKESVCNIYFN